MKAIRLSLARKAMPMPLKQFTKKGEPVWGYPYPVDTDKAQRRRVNNRFKQEQIEFVKAIRTGEYLNDSGNQVNSTRMAFMGRVAAYTGKDVTWEEVLNSDLELSPQVRAFGPVPDLSEESPIVGTTQSSINRYT